MTFALVLLAVPAVAYGLEADPTGSTTSASPTIQSDQADYPPGATVNLSGSGWQAGESVNIKVNDDAGQTWSRNVDVVADSSGNISDSFNLPNWFVATYSVTATGVESGVATTSFTDTDIRVRAKAGTTNLAVNFLAGDVDRFNNTTCTLIGTAPNATNASAFTTLTDGSYVGSGVTANNGQSAKIVAPSPVTSDGKPYNFSSWSGTTVNGTINVSATGCITRTGTANELWDMTANYVEAPTVTSIDRVGLSPTNTTDPVQWTVKFSQSVTGVDIGDFDLIASSGLPGAAFPSTNALSGSGDTYIVTANAGNGDGTLGLNLDDDDSIIAGAGNPLGGTGTTTTGNGDFTGQVYTIDRTAPTVTIVSTNPTTLEETDSSTITWKANETGTYSVRLGGTDCATATQVPAASGTNLSGNYTTANTNVVTTVDADALAEGANTVRVCVTDAATNVGSSTTTITKNLIRQTTTTLTQTTGTNPSTYGDSVTFTATVTASAGNPNSVGTVDFKDGSTVITGCDNVALSGNTATCSPSLDAGSYSLTAEYSGVSSGSPKFTASTSSPALSHTVDPKTPDLTFDLTTLPAKTFGDAPFSLEDYVETDSPGTLSYALGNGSVGCSVNSTTGLVTITGVAVGTSMCVIEVSQAATTNYTAAGPVSQSFNIAKAPATLEFATGTLSQTFDTNPKPVTVNTTPANLTGVSVSYFATDANGAKVGSALSGAPTNAGSYVVEASLTNANYTAPTISGTLNILHSYSGVTQPINGGSTATFTDDTSIFKQGSTVPVKFQLTGASAGITDGVFYLWVQKVGNSDGVGEVEALSTAAATTGNLFRYDATSGQYIFNLGTKSLAAGQYEVRIYLNNGDSTVTPKIAPSGLQGSVQFELKR